MTVPRLHAVTDDARLADAGFVGDAAAVLEAGGPALALHLRGRGTSAARLYALASELLPVARAAGAKLVVNDRVDVALAVGADGAQLPEDSLDASRARAILGRHALIGISRHGASFEPDDLRDADFVVWGSVFETTSHPGQVAEGVAALEAVVRSLRSPVAGHRRSAVIAIGGITPENAGGVMSAGAYGVAALGGIWAAPRGSPSDAVHAYRAALGTDAGRLG